MTQTSATNDRLINEARRAIESGHAGAARPLLEKAARQDTRDPRPWLLLAGIAATPRERRAYLAQARRLEAPAARRPEPAPRATTPPPPPPARPDRRPLWVGLGVLLLLLLAGSAALAFLPAGQGLLGDMAERVSALTGAEPVATPAATAVAAAPPTTAIPSPTQAVVEAALSPTPAPAFPTKPVSAGGQPLPTWTPTALPTPTLAPTLTPSPTPEPSPTTEPVPVDPGALSPRPPGVGETERWIDVNLSTQSLVAYEGDTPVYNALVSSGLPQCPTVTGQFRTYIKYESQTMNGYLLGYDYYLPDVPYVMYFYKDYAIHGAYWHNNFGQPMSHGCVNTSIPDAGWLFNWAPVGTLVNVRY